MKKFKFFIFAILCLIALNLNNAQNVHAAIRANAGSPIIIRVYVDGTLNQQNSITIHTTSTVTSTTTFISKARPMKVNAVTRGTPTDSNKPNITSLPSAGYTFNSSNSAPGGAVDDSYIYVNISAPITTTGYSWAGSAVRMAAPSTTTGYKDSPVGTSLATGGTLLWWRNGNLGINLVNAGIREYSYTNASGKKITQYASGAYIDIYFKANSYTLNYNANEGTVSPASKTVTYNSTYGTLATPTRTGYTFDGWYTAASGGTNVTASSKYTTAGNSTIYAHWKANSYTLNYNANGGTVSPASKTVTYDGTYGSLPTPTRSNWTFLGWYTAISGGDKVEASAKYTTAGAKTIYAHWSRDQYTVKFNPNGGTGSMADQAVNTNEDAALNAMSGFSRTGFAFKGWATGLYTNNIAYANRGAINSLASKGGTVTLYAVWQRTGTGFKQLPMFHTDMFKNDKALTGGAGTGYNSKQVDGNMAHVDGSQDRGPGYFSTK